MTKAYLLRVEAVNIAGFVLDTQDLSTIRGGGLLLLDIIEKLPAKHAALAPVTTGASAGLFRFEAEEEAGAERLRQDIETDLRRDPCLKHATFVVDFVATATDESFIEDRERVIARNRWRQMRQPSLAVPARNTLPLPVCTFDRLRPAPESVPDPDHPGKGHPVSTSVKRRRDFGRSEKQGFYQHMTGIEAAYTLDLGELTALDDMAGDAWDAVPWNLEHKMAVIHVDGNRFGKIQDRVATSGETQRAFDSDLKAKRKRLLTSLIETMTPGSTWKTPDGKNRIDTLLWGGDEITWVVPAWKGWETLSRFFALTADWRAGPPPGTPLTHAAGLVFCQYKAPIHRIVGLAHDLAERAKGVSRERDSFGYAVLESFDHIGEGIDDYLAKRCPKGLDPARGRRDWILPGAAMDGVADVIRGIKAVFPRRKLSQLVQDLLDDPARAAATLASVRKGAAGNDGEALDKSIGTLRETLGLSDVFWFHVAELWDYLP